ncbi:MAG: tetratricopeptide repeat protein [Kofleriaceae bacterium]
MVDPDRRPTAQEIEELIDLVRRDPGSPAFVDLGEAYLALGRPRDAAQIGNVGLQSAPDSVEGRVMLSRAFVAMHQWKEAQGELLRVVKVDRSNRIGFALLGEVLLRRSDFERAVPVLQHAQNLDPTSPTILAMLKRARAGQGLDPPPPIPSPMPPRGETHNDAEIVHSQDLGSTALDPPRKLPPLPGVSPPLPGMSPAPPVSAAMRSQRPSVAPPQMSVEGIRPRLIAEKPQNAAAASLRTSAAAGENYLNDLLTGGLLDVAGVRVPDQEYDLRPDRRWGRSTRRAFIFLFVVLVLGIGGGGTWYWWTEKQKSEAIARLSRESKQAIIYGDFAGFETSIKKLSDALKNNPSNVLTFAYVAETGGLEALLYGTDDERVDKAFKAVGAEIKPEEPGARELVIGRASVELSRLGTGEGAADAIAASSKSTLADVIKSLDAHLAKHPDDRWATWLKGRALLAGGERKAARATLKAASDGEDGLVIAMVEYADVLVDDGQLDDALKIYDRALAKSKDHPLALVGRSLGRAEASMQLPEAIEDLSVRLDKNLGKRVGSYRQLALAFANQGIEDFPKAKEALTKATAASPPNEPRFWARIGWVHYINGQLADAAKARARIAWYGKSKAEDDPTVQLLDAGLLLASGLPSQALELASKLNGTRARTLRTYALLDLKKWKDAASEADAILATSPNNVEVQILREHARMVGTTGKDQMAAHEALDKLARRAKSKLGRHALGAALLDTGNAKEAQSELQEAITDITDVSPNPLAYRTHTRLAEVLLAANDITGARKHLDEALKLNSGFFPTLTLQALVVLRAGDPDQALALLDPIFKEQAAVTPIVKLTAAEALIVSKRTTAKQKQDARQLLEAVKDQLPPADVARVAALLDPNLPKEMGLPEPAGAKPAAPAPPPKRAPPPRRGGRRR